MWYNLSKEKMKDYRLKALAYFGIGGGLLKLSSTLGILYPLSIAIIGGFFIFIAVGFYLNSKFEQQWLSKVLALIESAPTGCFGLFLTTYGISIYLIQGHYIVEGFIVAVIAYCVFGYTIGKILGRDILRPIFNKLNIFQTPVEIPEEFRNPDWDL